MTERSSVPSSDAETRGEFWSLKYDAQEFGLAWDGPPVVARGGVPTSDGDVSFLRWGPGRPSVVLLHGVALNAHTWDTFALAARRPLLALDLPGHGSSAWREDGAYGPATVAPAVAEVVRAEATPPVALVGQSLGGLAAVAVSALIPGLVAKLVLVDVSPGIGRANQVRQFLAGPTSFSSRDEIVDRARSFGIGHSRDAVARGVWHNTVVRDDGSVAWKHHVGNMGDGRALSMDLATLWAPLEAFPGPVLVVRGERGFLTPENVEEVRQRLPKADVVEVPTGHNVQEEAPVLLAQVVCRFLDHGTASVLDHGTASGAGQGQGRGEGVAHGEP